MKGWLAAKAAKVSTPDNRLGISNQGWGAHQRWPHPESAFLCQPRLKLRPEELQPCRHARPAGTVHRPQVDCADPATGSAVQGLEPRCNLAFVQQLTARALPERVPERSSSGGGRKLRVSALPSAASSSERKMMIVPIPPARPRCSPKHRGLTAPGPPRRCRSACYRRSRGRSTSRSSYDPRRHFSY